MADALHAEVGGRLVALVSGPCAWIPLLSPALAFYFAWPRRERTLNKEVFRINAHLHRDLEA